MKIPNTAAIRTAIYTSLVVLGCLSLAVTQIPAARAAEAQALRPLADNSPALPLTPTYKKVPDSEDGPYALSLENVSKDTLKVSAKIYPSVTFHANAKVRNLPDHVIDPGQVWTITGLASTDKVTLTADGFAPLELTVP
jgi:hypothetical protein